MQFIRKHRRWLIVVGVILILVLAIGRKQGWFGNQAWLKVSTEEVIHRDIIEVVTANGKIQPEMEVKVSPDISGEVIELYVKEGDEVTRGSLLARIDPEIYKSNYDRLLAALSTQKANESNAKARLAQAEAQFKNTELSFKRNETLWKQGVISEAEYDAAKAAFEVARAEVQSAEHSVKAATFTVRSAEASVQEARENLQKTSIYAPNDGTVSRLNVEQGERVVGASQFSSGTEIMRIANLRSMEVKVSVSENDIVRVSLGDTCIVEVDAYLDNLFKGLVTEIATSAETLGASVDQVTNFDVRIQILPESYQVLMEGKDSSYSPFRPGMSATVDIQTRKTRQVVAVPIQSVTTRDADSTAAPSGEEEEKVNEVVFLFEDGKARMQSVQTGIQDNMYIQILEGLDTGQEVISAPYRAISRTLKDGDHVEKVSKDQLFKEE
jgi:HlyD family secretion protein